MVVFQTPKTAKTQVSGPCCVAAAKMLTFLSARRELAQSLAQSLCTERGASLPLPPYCRHLLFVIETEENTPANNIMLSYAP